MCLMCALKNTKFAYDRVSKTKCAFGSNDYAMLITNFNFDTSYRCRSSRNFEKITFFLDYYNIGVQPITGLIQSID